MIERCSGSAAAPAEPCTRTTRTDAIVTTMTADGETNTIAALPGAPSKVVIMAMFYINRTVGPIMLRAKTYWENQISSDPG